MLACAVIATAAFLSCSDKAGKNSGDSVDTAESFSSTVPMPVVPDSLTDPVRRADYLLAHFWDGVDFSDRRVMSDSIMIEQGVSDFISVMEFCSPQGLNDGVTRLLDKASAASQDAYSRMADLARLYLWDPQSPFRSERFYTPFVEYAIARGGAEGIRAEAQLEEIRRNAPGTMAPDFTVVSAAGRNVSLKKETAKGRPVVVMFYEPDCDHCENAIAALKRNRAFGEMVESGQLGFLAVYIGDGFDLWKEHAAGLPSEWTTCIDRGRMIDDGELYVVNSTPSFYLIGSDGRIMLKDEGLQGLYRSLDVIMQ